MRHPINNENSFVVDLLTTLQKDRFSLAAWERFLIRSWDMSCKTANSNLSLKRSWSRVTILMGVLVFSVCITVGILEGPILMLHLLPGFVFCVAWQQSDTFWHLGLNKHIQTAKPLSTFGVANVLTGLRGLGASFLLGRLLGGLATHTWLALAVFLFGVVTDILDGQVARRTHTQSKLGQIIDGETDFCLYLALSIILMQDRILALWLGLVLILRFFVPLTAALGSYFLFTQPVRFGSTLWGKCAGLAQCLYFFVLLAPPQLVFLTQVAHLPLLIVTIFFAVAAPMAQIVANL
ncbi:MAG: hypothetical protein PVS3B3_33680 [Ktedonobacteraceae bacterium]